MSKKRNKFVLGMGVYKVTKHSHFLVAQLVVVDNSNSETQTPPRENSPGFN